MPKQRLGHRIADKRHIGKNQGKPPHPLLPGRAPQKAGGRQRKGEFQQVKNRGHAQNGQYLRELRQRIAGDDRTDDHGRHGDVQNHLGQLCVRLPAQISQPVGGVAQNHGEEDHQHLT